MVPIRRAEHVVLIGDHQQLQAVIQSKDAEKMGLGKSLFERYATKRHPIHVLETQYRMVSMRYQALTILLFLQHPAICEFPSKAFYNGRLKTDPSVMRRQSGLNLTHFWPKHDSPIVFCQVEGEEETGHIGSRGSSSQSKFNMTEAKKIVEIAEKLVCHYRVPNSEIAILTPYSAQKRLSVKN
ncbi:Helicase with zinc finger domain 2 [Geodia barretti]|uniref:Helicase with zinc finger domain 2 n=1 Tax=Geodia barretti TaxID=519541 RepID=A0AA35THB7_GEOBA|nr:Helicase with zinc finger domain 2 [Geodia barretti]